MENDPKLPANVVYERGMTFGTLSCIGEMYEPVREQIDWDQQIEPNDSMLNVTRAAATQFHYANTSHLILCGKLIKQELGQTSADLTKLAVYLSGHKLDGADIWGRYIERTDARESISQPVMAYYRQLFSESDALTLIVGMETLAGPTAYVLYDKLQHLGDPLFQQITEQMAEQKRDETQHVVEALSPEIAALSDDEQDNLLAQAARYSSLTESLLTFHKPHFTTAGLDDYTVKQQARKHVQQFYEDLGLTD